MNLPLFGAQASGLFADHGLDVELVAPAPRPAAAGAPAPAAGRPARADFAVAAVQSNLTARARRPEAAHPRFVAVVHQHSPLAAFVPLGSRLRWPSDLAGARVAASTAPWFDHEFRAGLEAMGLGPPHVVPRREDGVPWSLVDGEVDAVGSWEEAIAVIRRRAGTDVRAIPFGPRVYTTGVVAEDRVPAEVVTRMVSALRAAFEEQRSAPHLGLDALCRRFPGVDPGAALEEWGILVDYVFAGGRPLAMTAEQWERTIAHAARTHGIVPLAVDQVCRTDALLAMPAMPVGA